jgi:hypothetical protein
MSNLKQVVSNPMPQVTQDDAEEWSMDDHWPTLVHGLADQITQTLSALQNQLDQLLQKERISRMEHRALSIPAERIKQAGLVAQQIHRFHGGRIRQSHERINMAELVENLLQERRKEFAVIGVELRRKLKPVDVLTDPTVAYAFVNAALDWAMPFSQRVDVRLDINSWPPHARLQIRANNDSQAELDGMAWLLVRQIAQAGGGIELKREVSDDCVALTAMFTRTVQAVDGIAAVDLSDDQSSMFKSLQGIYALTISPSLQVRADVRDALREIDIEQARDAMRHRMPSLIVIDSDLKGSAFDNFRKEVLRDVMEFPFVEISADSNSFDMSGFDEMSMAKVGRGNIRETLGTAVMFELAKMM